MAPDAHDTKKTLVASAYSWGQSSLPPMLLATFATALHARPFQPLPMLFPPVFLFSTYLNLNGFVVDSAGLTAAWSGLYMVLATRRHQSIRNKFTARGVVRGAAIGTAAVNAVSCGMVYVFEKRGAEDARREDSSS